MAADGAGGAGSRTLLLTGATDGIGLALARRWKARGERAWLCGRRSLDGLDAELFGAGSYLRADLADPAAAEEIVAALDERDVGALDRLVLNAGTGWYGATDQQLPASIEETFEVNLWAPLALVHALLPRLRAARGRVTFVSSVVSALPCPQLSVYAASKAALEGFARSLRRELEGEVDVQVVRPGATRTRLHEKCGALEKGLDPRRFAAVDDVALAVDEHVFGSPRWVTVGVMNRAFRFAGRNLPRVVDRVQAGAAARARGER